MAEGNKEKKEITTPTYLRFGRGDNTKPLLLNRELVELITKQVRGLTLEGKMATAGGTTGRTPEGTKMADALFEFAELLESSHD